jgi:hypothetical protein
MIKLIGWSFGYAFGGSRRYYQVLLLRIGTLMPKKRKMGRSFRFGSMVEMIWA